MMLLSLRPTVQFQCFIYFHILFAFSAVSPSYTFPLINSLKEKRGKTQGTKGDENLGGTTKEEKTKSREAETETRLRVCAGSTYVCSRFCW